jgi:hypothetical protein
VLAFVVLVVFWGVVNLLASSVGFNKGVETTPDYVEKNGGDFKSIAPRSPSDNSAATTLPTKPASGRPINLPPPEYGGTEDNFADCGNGQSFDSKGNPCGIY